MLEKRFRRFLPLALLVAILAVSTSSVMIRFAQEEAPSPVIAALRLACAALLLAPLAWTRHREELRSLTRQQMALGILSGVFLAVHFASWTSSLEYTSVASSVMFVSTGPLWVALLSPLLLNERLAAGAVLGMLVALPGGILIGLADACAGADGSGCLGWGRLLQGRAMWGNFLALLGAWTVSGYLIVGRKLRQSMSLVPYVFVVYAWCAAALIVMMLAAGHSPLGYPAETYGWIFLLAVFPQLIGHSTYNWALRYLPAALVALVTLIEPITSAVLAFFILRETPAAGVLVGGLFVLAGIHLASRAAGQKRTG